MKMCFIALLLLLSTSGFAQDLPRNKDGKVEYSEVVTVDSATASMLHSRAELFISKVFNSGKAVIQVNNAQEKQITGNGAVKIVLKETFIGNYEFGRMKFNLTIQSKDGKYRYFINDFVHEDNGVNVGSGGAIENEKPACGTFKMPKKRWAKMKDETARQIGDLIVEMKNYMKGAAAESSKDW